MSFGSLWRSASASLRGRWGKTILLCIVCDLIVNSFPALIDYTVCPTGLGRLVRIALIPVAIGEILYFLRLAKTAETGEDIRFESIFEPFGQYGRMLLVSIVQFVLIALWSFLLVIPGIIAFYRYCLVEFIVLEDKEISVMDAIDRSCWLMRGYKLRLFGYLLLLMLIGGVVCTLTFGIGLIWFIPFLHSFMAGFYLRVKEEKGSGPSPEKLS